MSSEITSLETLSNSLNIINKALFLPIYLYRNQTLIKAFPEKAANYPPLSFYQRNAVLNGSNSPFISTNFNSYYGYLCIPSLPDTYIFIGPVAQLAYSQDDFRRIFSGYQIAASEQDSCTAFFQNIPCYLMQDFGNVLRMVNHFLDGSPNVDFSFISDIPSDFQIRSRSVINTYEQNYLFQSNNSLLYEKVLTDIIEQGQVAKLQELNTDFFMFNKGVLANNPLRNLKNLTIVCITLFSRAAIRAGMDTQLALQMSDLYIMNTESGHNADEVSQQVTNALFSYTTEVAKIHQNSSRNSGFEAIITFVREHSHYPLSVSHIAAEFGYNSDYLSRSFKKELGFSLSSFISRTKLEKSKELLRYTNKSILEISEYLCFSSQSYFQNLFRKQYNTTPMQYRKMNREETHYYHK